MKRFLTWLVSKESLRIECMATGTPGGVHPSRELLLSVNIRIIVLFARFTLSQIGLNYARTYS